METITITKRTKGDKVTYNKKFDGYERGYLGGRISKREFNEIYEEYKKYKVKHVLYESELYGTVERYTYEN
jgi:hypothetical protein